MHRGAVRSILVISTPLLLLVVGCASGAASTPPSLSQEASPSPLAWLALGMFATVATALGRRGGRP